MKMKKRPIKLKIERAERIICENIFTVKRFIIENTDTFSNDLKKIKKKKKKTFNQETLANNKGCCDFI